MKTTILIIYNRLITFICKIFKRNGSVFPGSLVKKHDLNILKKVKYPKYVIGITGSYGKTSSKNILNDILSIKFELNNGEEISWAGVSDCGEGSYDYVQLSATKSSCFEFCFIC